MTQLSGGGVRGVARAQTVKCWLVGEVLDGQTKGGRRRLGSGGLLLLLMLLLLTEKGGKNAGVLRQRGVN